MENENVVVKTKSNKGIIIVLIILLIGACGYIAYDKFLVKDEPKTTEDKSANSVVKKDKNDTEELDSYTTFINNIKTRKNAESINFRNVPGEDNGYKTFILGTDNKIYKETYDDNDTKIPGAIGSGGEYTGKYIGVDKVVRIFKTYHSPIDGGAYDGMLVLKEDGSLYIIRNIETSDYKLEKLDYKNIVTAFDTITGQGTTYVVDITGKQYAIK